LNEKQQNNINEKLYKKARRKDLYEYNDTWWVF